MNRAGITQQYMVKKFHFIAPEVSPNININENLKLFIVRKLQTHTGTFKSQQIGLPSLMCTFRVYIRLSVKKDINLEIYYERTFILNFLRKRDECAFYLIPFVFYLLQKSTPFSNYLPLT